MNGPGEDCRVCGQPIAGARGDLLLTDDGRRIHGLCPKTPAREE